MKFGSEVHGLFSNTYRKAAIDERTCFNWFHTSTNGDFNVEHQHGGGRNKISEYGEFWADYLIKTLIKMKKNC